MLPRDLTMLTALFVATAAVRYIVRTRENGSAVVRYETFSVARLLLAGWQTLPWGASRARIVAPRTTCLVNNFVCCRQDMQFGSETNSWR